MKRIVEIIFISLILNILILPDSAYGTAGREVPGPFINGQPDSLIYKNTPQGDLSLYLHYPDDWQVNDKRPAIVFFFGGGWNSGTVNQFLPQAIYFAERGMVTIRADYRVFKRHGTLPPDCVEDGKSAIRWVRQHAAELGIDPGRIVSSGGSAGGHVAACTYLTTGLEAEDENMGISSRPNLLVLFNPAMRTTGERFEERMGGARVAKQISPIDNLGPNVPPMIMFYGATDKLMKPAVEVLEMAGSLDIQVELWTAPDKGHGFFNRSPWLEWTNYLTHLFLKDHGYLKGSPEDKPPASVKMIKHK